MRPRLHASRCLWVAYCLLGTGILGCGPERIGLEQVEGTVLYQNQPVSDALVMLHPKRSGQDPRVSAMRPRGRTDARGAFFLTTYDASDGAPAGEYVVTVEWPERLPDPDGGPESFKYGGDRLQGRYATEQTSPLSVTITPGQTKLAPIVLE